MRIALRSAACVAAVFLWVAGSGCAPLLLDSDQVARLQTFDRYWKSLQDNYPYFTRGRPTPTELRDQYRAAAAFAADPLDFYHVLVGLLCELEDAHVSLELPGGLDTASPTGLVIGRISGKNHVLGWPEGQEPYVPEHLADADRHFPQVLAIDGYPVPQSSLLDTLLSSGRPESLVELDLEWPDGTRSRHYVSRDSAPEASQDSEPGSPEIEEAESSDEDSQAYSPPIELVYRALGDECRNFKDVRSAREHSDSIVPVLEIDSLDTAQHETAKFEKRFDECIDQALQLDASAIVIDLRWNGGGTRGLSSYIIARFLRRDYTTVLDTKPLRGLLPFWFGVWLTFQLPDGRYYPSSTRPREPHWPGKVIVLVSQFTASAAEAVTLGLQRGVGAIVIGEPTAGAEATLVEIPGRDGSKLTFGAAREVDATGRGLQDIGAIPNLPAVASIEELRSAAIDRTEPWEADLGAFRHWALLNNQRTWDLVDRVVREHLDEERRQARFFENAAWIHIPRDLPPAIRCRPLFGEWEP